jgi:hypothetical protein
MLSYYKRLFMVLWKDFSKSTRGQVVGALVAVAILVLQIHYGVIGKQEIKGNEWAIALPYTILVLCLFVYHAVHAPWEIDQELRGQLNCLKSFKQAVEEEEVHLEPSNPLCTTFVTTFNWENGSSGGLCLRATFMNKRKPGVPGKIAEKVAAKITYFDQEREPFTLDGRWARTNQPASYNPLQDKTEILRVDFHPGTQHELDIANKIAHQRFCYAVAYDDLQARQLFGPKVKVKIELIAVHVLQVFECVRLPAKTGHLI